MTLGPGLILKNLPAITFHYAECRYAECRYAKCHYAEYRYVECRYAKCHYAECRYVECHHAECHYAECHGALPPAKTDEVYDGNTMAEHSNNSA